MGAREEEQAEGIREGMDRYEDSFIPLWMTVEYRKRLAEKSNKKYIPLGTPGVVNIEEGEL